MIEQIIARQEEEFDARFGIYWSKDMEGNVIYGGNNNLPANKWTIIKQENIKAWHSSSIKEILDLAITERDKEIVEWLQKRCGANIRIHGTDKWNSDMEDLIEYLTNTDK